MIFLGQQQGVGLLEISLLKSFFFFGPSSCFGPRGPASYIAPSSSPGWMLLCSSSSCEPEAGKVGILAGWCGMTY